MRTTLIMLVLNLVVCILGFGVYFLAYTITIEWTPAFGLGFGAGVVVSGLVVLADRFGMS